MILASRLALGNEIEINVQTIGRTSLNLPGNIKASIVEFDKGVSDGHRFWKSKLVIKEDSKILMERYPIFEDDDENFFFYFVPIKNKKYIMDLDKNKDYEFAIAVDHGGNAPSTTAIVFSLKGSKLQVYERAWYQMEGGQEIIWSEDKVPKKYIYTSQDVREEL